MKVKEMSLDDFIKIAEREESHFYDNKAKEIKPAKIEKIAVAFANADGGEICIGIKDKKEEIDFKKRWDGFEKIEDMNSILQSLFNLEPNVEVNYEFLTCKGLKGYVLKINVEKGSEIYKTSEGLIFQRQGSQSLPIKDPTKIMELTFAKGAKSFEDMVLKDVVAEQIIESSEINNFLKDISPKTDALDFCVNQNLFDYKTWEPKICSVLLFHSIPAAVMPRKCSVKITRYESKNETIDRDQMKEQVTVEGPLIKVIRETAEKVSNIISSVSVMTIDGLKKMDYPPEALWEIIVNAVIHRDYSISDDVQIYIFDNRVEVLSPGKLPGYVTTENILDARFSRNTKIVRTLNRYSEPPNKDMGEGLNTTFEKMKEWGLKEPKIVEEGNYVKVVLPHTPLASPSESILRLLKIEEQINNQQARDITGIKSENLVKREFYKLRDQGILEKVPDVGGSKSAWRLTEKGKDEVKKY